MSQKTQIVTNAADFFREVVTAACEQRRLKILPFTQEYLTNLLGHYISTDNLFDEENENGQKNHMTLAEMYLNATSIESGVRLDLLKKLGDTSLYISGFFGESLSRKIVDADYYANMGGLAYGSLSNIVREEVLKQIYLDFSTHFVEYADVLTLISQKMMVQTNDNLLRLYDLYLRTGSELAKETLLEKGINVVPQENKKPSNQ